MTCHTVKNIRFGGFDALFSSRSLYNLVGFFSKVCPAFNYYSHISLLKFEFKPPTSFACCSTMDSSLTDLHASTRVLPSQSSSFRIIILNDELDYVPSLLRLSSDLPLKMSNSRVWPIKPSKIQILLNSQSSFYIYQLNC